MSSLYSFITGTAESLAARSPPYSSSFTAASFSSGRSNFFTEEKRGTAFTWTSCWSSWRQRLCSYFSNWETETSLTWIWQCVQRKATGWGWNIPMLAMVSAWVTNEFVNQGMDQLELESLTLTTPVSFVYWKFHCAVQLLFSSASVSVPLSVGLALRQSVGMPVQCWFVKMLVDLLICSFREVMPWAVRVSALKDCCQVQIRVCSSLVNQMTGWSSNCRQLWNELNIWLGQVARCPSYIATYK